ncbi:oxidoreductase [Achlya hypogyna]|uniref:Oxidoreductase n=1 Tax=Achlya hypogyna TaxID=1202772 RepID=A0A1V9YV38_ACHHY|nr:oxidoreductase [Achlya hypogyna]
MLHDSQGIAVIDLALPAAHVTKNIAAACTSSGCFHIINHGVTVELIERVWAELDAFFALPLAEKEACARPSPSDYHRYSAFRVENIAAFMGRKGEPNDPIKKFDFSNAAEGAMTTPNMWPADRPEFRATMESYYAALKGVTTQLFGHFALALDVPHEYFSQRTSTAANEIKLKHYPPIQDATRRFAEHTDSVPFTLLLVDDSPNALHAKTPLGWVPVAPVPGGLFVNLGNVLQR